MHMSPTKRAHAAHEEISWPKNLLKALLRQSSFALRKIRNLSLANSNAFLLILISFWMRAPALLRLTQSLLPIWLDHKRVFGARPDNKELIEAFIQRRSLQTLEGRKDADLGHALRLGPQ